MSNLNYSSAFTVYPFVNVLGMLILGLVHRLKLQNGATQEMLADILELRRSQTRDHTVFTKNRVATRIGARNFLPMLHFKFAFRI
jgi:hypothetical protein